MRPTISLIRREFTAYFLSPIAYVVLAVFLLVTGHLFYLTLNSLTESGPRGIEFPMQQMLGDEKFWLVFLFIPPLLTMRLFAEERGTGTLEMLMTAPVRDWQVVLSKFVACFLFFLVMWAPTMLYWPVLTDMQLNNVAFDWKFTNASIPVLIAAGACLAIFFTNVLPFPDELRFVVLTTLTIVPSALYIWVYDMDVMPGFLNAPFVEKSSMIIVQAVYVAMIYGIFFLFPFALSRLFGESFGVSTLVAGWAQFALALVYVVVHLVRTHYEGKFDPIHVTALIDPKPLAVSYLGVILAGAMFLSLGLFVSSLVRSQMVAALVSLVLSLLFIVGGFWRPEMDTSSLLYQIIYYVSVPLHFNRDFTRGILNSGHLVLYVSTTLFFLFMTVRSLESRRWK